MSRLEPRGMPVAEELVELGDAGLAARLRSRRPPASRWIVTRGANTSMPFARDDERVLVAAVVGAAHLDDLEEALLLAGLLALATARAAVDDREERVGLELARARTRRGGAPWSPRPSGSRRARSRTFAAPPSTCAEIVEDLEAVDDHDGRLDLLDVLHDELDGRLEPLRAQHDAEVDELDAAVELLRIEERELLQVAQGLGGRLRERAEVEDAAARRGVVKADLLGEDRLARARRARSRP